MTADHLYFRGTFLGHFIRVISNEKLLRYPEENDPSLFTVYLVKEEESQTDRSKEQREQHHRQANGLEKERISSGDPKKGLRNRGDPMIVDWYGPDDPEVSVLFLSKRIHRTIPSN